MNIIIVILTKLNNRLSKILGYGYIASDCNSEVKIVKKFIDKAELVVDIGANKGDYTDAALKTFKSASFILFEPVRALCDALKERFKHNDNVMIVASAVSDQNCDGVLYSDKIGSGLASLYNRKLKHKGIRFDATQEIKLIKFFDYWAAHMSSSIIDLIKIDVEGNELKVLFGMGDAINYTKIVQFEFGGCNIDSRIYFIDFWEYFQSVGFELYRMSMIGPIKITQYNEQYENFSGSNFLAVNKRFLINS